MLECWHSTKCFFKLVFRSESLTKSEFLLEFSELFGKFSGFREYKSRSCWRSRLYQGTTLAIGWVRLPLGNQRFSLVYVANRFYWSLLLMTCSGGIRAVVCQRTPWRCHCSQVLWGSWLFSNKWEMDCQHCAEPCENNRLRLLFTGFSGRAESTSDSSGIRRLMSSLFW